MSDMYTWLTAINGGQTIPFEEGEVVQISKEYGGGVGQYVGFSPVSGKCIVDVKGTNQEYPVDDLEAVVDSADSFYVGNSEEQRYDEIDNDVHSLPDKPELQAGDMVKINDIYGAGNGEGFGVFVAYALDGKSVICNVDSQDGTYPISNVTLAPEERAADNFASTGNDGSLSPMSYGEDNRDEIKFKGEEHERNTYGRLRTMDEDHRRRA